MVFVLLNCVYEKKFESQNKITHSYSSKIKSIDSIIWKKAWVNRTAIFLRRYIASKIKKNHNKVFGIVKPAKIIFTIDLDVMKKHKILIIKQSVFNLLIIFKNLFNFEIEKIYFRLRKIYNILFKNSSYNNLIKILSILSRNKIETILHVYSKNRNNSITKKIFDPDYSLDELNNYNFKNIIKKYKPSIGIHPSYDNWKKNYRSRAEKHELEKFLNQEVLHSRQHWLKFSFKDTWKNLIKNGIKFDSTLGFNDLPGFRNSAAIFHKPTDLYSKKQLEIISAPLILMDSQIVDYMDMSEDKGKIYINNIIKEVFDVCGEATVLYHHHTYNNDYGYKFFFHSIIQNLKKYKKV